MLKYLAKIAMDIFPSVLATIIGAYIVNHYINAKPAANAPSVAAAPAEPGKSGGGGDLANIPGPGVKARGLSERSLFGHWPTEKADTKSADLKATDSKSAEAKAESKPTESKPAEPAAERRHQPTLRERAMARISPATAAPASTATPAVVEPAHEPVATEEHRDAAELARAAIARLRKSPEARQPLDAGRPAETSQDMARAAGPAAPALQPLPPPITVSAPSVDGVAPPYTGAVSQADRPTPPAEIPVPIAAPPLDLRADADTPAVQRGRSNVAQDMLFGVKSMFQAVLPKNATPD